MVLLETLPRRRAGVVDNSRSVKAAMRAVPISRVRMLEGFWFDRIQAGRTNGLPKLLRLLEEHGVIDNFRRIRGKDVERRGPVFTDSDLFKWMEAASLYLQSVEDRGLESRLEDIIEDVIGAQAEDGYLNTHFVWDRAVDRFSNLERDHELYCAGHLIQASVAHFRATGDTKLLEGSIRFADLLLSIFGPGRRRGFCGHPELEMAMVELYRTTQDGRYLEFASYLLDQIDFHNRREMEGHAVRAAYACCGGADYHAETANQATWEALLSLWEDMSRRKSYVTGGIGSRYLHEAFGEPYELPNLRAYAETCAAIGNAMWAYRMLLITGGCEYADMLERILFNGFLSGVSLSGDSYFYVNPLESSGGEGMDERTHQRKEWYSCTCCPTNVQRTLASLPGYIYGSNLDSIWINLYASSRLETEVGGGSATLTQQTDYPWSGKVDISLDVEPESTFALHLRVPSWTQGCRLKIEGETQQMPRSGAYVRISRAWGSHSQVELSFDINVRLVASHFRVREAFGCAAIVRGPIVYCLEGVDNPGFEVRDLLLPPSPEFAYAFDSERLGGIGTIRFSALVAKEGPLYGDLGYLKADAEEVEALAIPYYAWANRGRSSMLVWLPMAGDRPG